LILNVTEGFEWVVLVPSHRTKNTHLYFIIYYCLRIIMGDNECEKCGERREAEASRHAADEAQEIAKRGGWNEVDQALADVAEEYSDQAEQAKYNWDVEFYDSREEAEAARHAADDAREEAEAAREEAEAAYHAAEAARHHKGDGREDHADDVASSFETEEYEYDDLPGDLYVAAIEAEHVASEAEADAVSAEFKAGDPTEEYGWTCPDCRTWRG
jgi:hypothetical protein